MYRKVLVPMALDHGISPQTLEIAHALIEEGGEIVALHVHEAPEGTVGAFLDDKTVQSVFDAAKARLNEKVAGLAGVTAVIIEGHTARSIIDFASDNGVDCIVLGSHRPGLRDYLLGSTASRVVRHAPCAVHVMRTS